MGIISKNSEILFIYDAKMTNPNGDMDNENKPRMDYDTDTNLVSDVRLKRYFRDYFESQLGEEIFITQKAGDAKERGQQLKSTNLNHGDLIDCRLFGAVFAETGASNHMTGPIQFNWGCSLNKVELSESATITSSFSSGQGVGKDYRVKYSLIAFSGGINATVAQKNEEEKKGRGMTDADLNLFDQAMVVAIPFCRTRSKIGQTPRLYLRIEMINEKTFLKDMREFIEIIPEVDEYKIRQVKDFTVNLDALAEYLGTLEPQISRLNYWKDEGLKISGWNRLREQFQSKLRDLAQSQ